MWNVLIPAAVTAAGAYMSSRANSRAAEEAARMQYEGMKAQAKATNRAIEAYEQGLAQSDAHMRQLREDTAPGMTHLRGVVADPNALTPQQRAQLVDQRRFIGDTIRGSGFAGSGRTAASLFKRGETDFVNSMLTENARRADTAASGMAGMYGNAAGTMAQNQMTTGTNIGGAHERHGQSVGSMLSNVGTIGAQAGIANANLMGDALGSIGSIIANERRDSRYANNTTTLPKKDQTRLTGVYA